MKVRAVLIELWNRAIKYDETQKVYFNGSNNLYPNEIERAVSNSPTASKGSGIMSKYINGLGITNDVDMNGGKLSSIVKNIADDISVQYGSFIHITYGIELDGENFKIVPVSLKVLDYTKCRKRKEDDNDNDGIIVYGNYEVEETYFTKDKDKKEWYYPYSNNQDVIVKQIQADGKKILKSDKDAGLDKLLPHYRGQVFYLNLTPRYEYAISHFNSVFNDCDTEYRMGVYSNTMTREGFLGKLAVLVSGLDTEETDDIREQISGWLGSENASSIFFLEIENTENLENNFKIINVPSQYDDVQFENTEIRIRVNILGACNNIPQALVFGSDGGSIFGNSGELIKQMKLYYQEQTEWERQKIEETIKMLGWDIEIIPLIELEQEIISDKL